MISACHRRQKKLRPSPCSPTRLGEDCHPTCPPQPARSGRRFSAKSAMRKNLFTTEDTERTEELLFTTEARRHGERATGIATLLSPRQLPTLIFKFSLCLCA